MKKYLEITYPYISEYSYQLSLYIFINYLLPNKSILDIGFGKEEYLKAFQELGMQCYGIDYAPDAKFKPPKLMKCDINIENLPFEDNFFDYVFSKSTIEHSWNINHFLDEIYRVLKPSGTVIIMTPDWETCYRGFYNDFTHKTPFTIKSLREALLIFGFTNVKVDKFYQLPFIWRRPYLIPIVKLLSFFIPYSLRWVDKNQTKQRTLIRFSKELMLIGIGMKGDTDA